MIDGTKPGIPSTAHTYEHQNDCTYGPDSPETAIQSFKESSLAFVALGSHGISMTVRVTGPSWNAENNRCSPLNPGQGNTHAPAKQIEVAGLDRAPQAFDIQRLATD